LNDELGQPELSVVIPAYNEAEGIQAALEQVAAYFRSRALAGEIVVVDDGSTDGTAGLAGQASVPVAVRVLVNEQNRGKGYSVRRGILSAQGRYVGFTDADMATPIDQLDKVREALESGAEVVIGSRALPDSQIARHQPWWREYAGRLFGGFVRTVLLPGIPDSQCGFKFFSAAAAQAIFTRQRLAGWAFDVELLYIARRLGYNIVQVPVRWIDEPHSRVRMLRDGLKMAIDVLRIRWLHHDLRPAAQLPSNVGSSEESQ